MKVEFNIEGVDYSLPEKMTISQYQQIQSKQDIMGVDKSLFIISVLSGCPISTLRKVNTAHAARLFTYANKLFMGEDTKFQQTFEFGGKNYGFIPNINNISLGEYIDLDHFITDGVIKNLHNIVAILYRPLKYGQKVLGKYVWDIEEYSMDDFSTRAEMFKELEVEKAFSAANFFFHLGMESIKLMKDSLVEEMMTMEQMEKMNRLDLLVKKMDHHLLNIGVGMES
jgi:hypothetical protein